MPAISRRLAVAAVLAVGAAAGVASSAQAAQQTLPMMCDGTWLTVRTPSTNNNNQSYSVGQVVDGGSGHLIPLSFTFTFTPTGGPTFTQSSIKGGGHAGPQDPTVTCTATFQDDSGSSTITVTAVPRP
jgi:hypothetical protein